MNNFFHISFILIFIAFFGIRAYYHKKATNSAGEVTYKEGPWHNWLRKMVGIPFMLYFLFFLIRPSLLDWARFPLPLWAQWVGLALGLASLPLIWWVQWALDINFSVTLHVRDEHTLVTHGPYRWVRHPMYTVLYIHLLAILLLTANWFVGGIFLLMQTVIIALRLNNEEATMLEKFGDDYREYMKHTGRFLPKLGL